MRSALQSVEGVENVEVDFAAKTVTVTCSSGCSEEAIAAMIEALQASSFDGEVKN